MMTECEKKQLQHILGLMKTIDLEMTKVWVRDHELQLLSQSEMAEGKKLQRDLRCYMGNVRKVLRESTNG